MVCCSVAFNIYQYQQVEELSTTPENKQGDALKDTKRTYELSSTENSEEPKQNEKKSSGNTFLISDNNLAIIDETDERISNVSDVISGEVDTYSEAFFEYEFSLYLDDVVVDLLNGIEQVEKLKIVKLLNSSDIRSQDLELESKITKLFDKYTESILSGSEDVKCNSTGCYSSYVLTDSSVSSHIFMDSPVFKGGGSGYTLNNPDGTVRYVNFMFYP
jgi:hypothetical protein